MFVYGVATRLLIFGLFIVYGVGFDEALPPLLLDEELPSYCCCCPPSTKLDTTALLPGVLLCIFGRLGVLMVKGLTIMGSNWPVEVLTPPVPEDRGCCISSFWF